MKPESTAGEEKNKPKDEDIVSIWTEKIKKAQDNLKPYWEAENRYWNYWWMWSEREGPFLNNYVPPEIHAAVETITPRIAGEKPALAIVPRIREDMTLEEANALVQKTKAVMNLERYAWQEMDADKNFRTIVKRGLWLELGVGIITWKTDTTEEMEKRPVFMRDENNQLIIGADNEPIQMGEQEMKVSKIIYDAPFEEILDNTDFIYPLGYPDFDSLPWAVRRIVKWRSEIDESLYDPAKLKELDQSYSTKFVEQYKHDRLRIREFPEPLKGATTEDVNAQNYAIDESQIGNKKDDYKIELWELWIKRSRLYPQGKLYTIANQKVQIRKNTDNPTPDGDLPFYGWTPISDTFHLRGMGLPRQIQKAFLYKKRQRDQRLDNVDVTIQGRWLLQSDEDVDDDEFKAYPNNVIRLSNINNVKPVVAPDITNPSVREEKYTDEDMSVASGQNDFVQGGNPGRKETATGIEKLVQSANTRYDSIAQELNSALNRRGKLILKLFQKNWDKEKLVRIMGENGALEFLSLNPLEFQGDFDFQYDVKPALMLREIVREQGMSLLSIISKIPGANIQTLIPILKPLLGTFKEIGVNPQEIIESLTQPQIPPQELPQESPQVPEEAMNLPEPRGGAPTLGNIAGQAMRV